MWVSYRIWGILFDCNWLLLWRCSVFYVIFYVTVKWWLFSWLSSVVHRILLSATCKCYTWGWDSWCGKWSQCCRSRCGYGHLSFIWYIGGEKVGEWGLGLLLTVLRLWKVRWLIFWCNFCFRRICCIKSWGRGVLGISVCFKAISLLCHTLSKVCFKFRNMTLAHTVMLYMYTFRQPYCMSGISCFRWFL